MLPIRTMMRAILLVLRRARKKVASRGPVFITDRGRPTHVLLSIEKYQQLTGGQGSIVDSLGSPPGIEDVELEIPDMRDLARSADFT